MKRAFLIIVGALVLVGFLTADIAWPKTSIAEKTSAAVAEAAFFGEAEAPFVPKEAVDETSDGPSQGTKTRKLLVKTTRLAEAVSENHD